MSTKVSTDLIDLSSNTGGLVWAKGPTTGQPASATAGEMRVDTTTNTTLVYNGTQWKTLKETAFVVPPIPTHFLVIAGGGGGGGQQNSGGGGAGGFRTSYSTTGGGGSAESTINISLNTAYTITVGAGGAGASPYNIGSNGFDSLFATVTSTGGGGGGGVGVNGASGGSGGGAAYLSSSPGVAVTTPVVQGYDGGTGVNAGANYGSGGGGGAGGLGQNGTSSAVGNGGAGLASSITGSSVTRASGGSGGGNSITPIATPGGGSINTSDATPNTGGGGGGASNLPTPTSTSGKSGGSGVVILRYPTADIPYFTTTGTLNTPSATDTVADAAYPVTNLAYYKLDSNANDSGLGSGYIGQGAIFNGSSSKIVTSSKILDNKTNLTISLWIKDLGNANYSGIIGEGGDSGQAGYVLAAYPDNTTLEFWRSNGDNLSYVFVGGSYNFGLGNYWTHVAITVTPSEVKYYKNGVNVKTTSITNTSTVSSANNTTLMYNAQYNRYNSGTLDQVRIYDTALSSSNVALLYAETSATSSTLNYPTGTGGIALYEFSGNANSTSSSANNGTATDVLYAFNGTATDVTYGNGRFNEAANFNGSSSYITLPTGVDKNNNFTLSFWVNFNTLSDYDSLITLQLNYRIYTNAMSDGRLFFYDGNTTLSTSAGAVATGNWYNIVVTKSSTLVNGKGMIIYVNGVDVANNSVTANAINNTSAGLNLLGAYNASPGGNYFYLDGNVDQVRIFSSALAAGDVEDLYNEHFQTKFTDGSDTALMFTGGTGDITFLDTDPNFTADYLVVAGGGGGGRGSTGGSPRNGGGGGAGGLRTSFGSTSGGGSSSETSLTLTDATNYTVTVGGGGAGGTGNTSYGVVGSDSVFISITSSGGGRGAQGTAGAAGGNGGSGGGGDVVGVATANQGFNGGLAASTVQGGGGGGASEPGNTDGSMLGGDGLAVSITGSSVTYAGGGSAGTYAGSSRNPGGDGGGGDSGYDTTAALPGTNNLGGGGGASGMNASGVCGDSASGGSGVVILRYPNTKTITVGAGLTATTAAVGTDSVTTFTAGTGTITFS